jgi:cation transport regulator ChaC
VTGVAFKVASSDRDEVIKYLDYREKGGYQLAELLFHPNDDCREPHNVLVYMATKQNPNYLGPAPEKQIAEQIVSCVGPSGPNLEYFHKLVESLEQIGSSCVDGHLESIKLHLHM